MRIPVNGRPVGWYCTISMSLSGAPARYVSAIPSPVQIFALVVNGKTRPHPPVHTITAFAVIARTLPVRSSIPTTPHARPSSVRNCVVAGERAVLERGLEERMQHVEAGLVGGKPRAHLSHSSERTDCYTPVGLAAPGASPMFEPQQFVGHFVDEGLDHVLVAEPIAARDGVVDVLLDSVVIADYTGGAAFGRDRVAAHRVDLRDHRDIELGIALGDSDSGAESGAAATNQENIVRRGFHSILRAGVSGATGIKYSNVGPITI